MERVLGSWAEGQMMATQSTSMSKVPGQAGMHTKTRAGGPAGGECRGRLREGPHGPHERLDPAVSEPLSKVREPGTVGFDDEEHGPPVARLDGGWRCADQRGR